MNILVSVPPGNSDQIYYPIIWGILKSYFEQNSVFANYINWLDPIYEFNDPYSLLSQYSSVQIDVLALSCYRWNWSLQKEIGIKVKEKYPNCKVILGGPEVEYKDSQFFKNNSWVDFVCLGEAESTIVPLLENIYQKDGCTEITGVLSQHNIYKREYTKYPSRINLVEQYSKPWLSQKDYWLKLQNKHGVGALHVSYTTNRGCPYACSFCDWGSLTMSKTSIISEFVVKEEIDFIIKQLSPNLFFLTDANFGMYQRDLATAKIIAKNSQESGFPKYFYFSPSKNSPDQNFEIERVLFKSGLSKSFCLSLQHTDKDVIKRMRRKNLTKENLTALIGDLKSEDIPISVQLIVGSPGDTIEKWVSVFSDLMNMGLHSEYRIYPYALLPNAPASEKLYKDDNKIESFYGFCEIYGDSIVERLKPYYSKTKYIKSTDSFSQEEYVTMLTYGAFIQSLHNFGYTRFLSMLVKHICNVDYKIFYKDLFLNSNIIFNLGDILSRIKEHFWSWTEEKEDYFQMRYNSNFWTDPEIHLTLCLQNDLDRFYDSLTEYFGIKYKLDVEAIEFQKQLIMSFNYSTNKIKMGTFGRPWKQLWDDLNTNQLKDEYRIGYPEKRRVTYLFVDKVITSSGLKINWSELKNRNEMIHRFIECTYGSPFTRIDKAIHKEIVEVS